MIPGQQIIRFRHAQTGEVRVGLQVRGFPEHNSIGVYLPGEGEVVVHRDNLVSAVPQGG